MNRRRTLRERVARAGFLNDGAPQLGWLLFLGMLPIFWVFAPVEDLVGLPLSLLPFRQVNAVVEWCRPDGSQGLTIYAIGYTFQDLDGNPRRGVSHILGETREADAEVPVEYPAGLPWFSRIEGTRRSRFDLGATMVAVLPAVGLFGLILSMGERKRKLASAGEIPWLGVRSLTPLLVPALGLLGNLTYLAIRFSRLM